MSFFICMFAHLGAQKFCDYLLSEIRIPDRYHADN